ncbi:hypothetical protein [Desulfolithobacter dissulfuricans]|nr:hypothetical protein [Desulfolithobacter dissulfuricans]
MKLKGIIPALMTAAALMTCSVLPAMAEDSGKISVFSGRDSAVNGFLLSAGLKGLEPEQTGFSFSLQPVPGSERKLFKDGDLLDGQNITLSYEGSSGLLGFSAGYLYTTPDDKSQPTLLLGMSEHTPHDPSRAWYLAVDLSRTFKLDDNISLGIDSKTALMDDPFAEEDNRILSLLLSMPVLIQNRVTITPELQWSRTMSATSDTADPDSANLQVDETTRDVFYGGVSITFSY